MIVENSVQRKKPKVVLAPVNFAGMPILVVNALRKAGYIAEQMSYTMGDGNKLGYEMDVEFSVKEHGGRIAAQSSALKSYLERDFDIFHFWNRTFIHTNNYGQMSGIDLPIIKARSKRIAYRFTGFDLRLPSWDKKVNPHSPFNYGYNHLFDEELQKKYLGFLEEYVDQFLVQDPEMAQFAPPNTKVIPRALDLSKWSMIGVRKREIPLVVHAPTSKAVKGTLFIERAVQELRDEGIKFEFMLIQGFTHDEAKQWYERADIIVDQILIGATGVLTLEAWALGKPTVVNLREDLFNEFYNCTSLPIVNANPDNIKRQLKSLIVDFEKRQEIGAAGRDFVEKYHDIEKVMPQYFSLYDGLVIRNVTKPAGLADLDYLEVQLRGAPSKTGKSEASAKKIELLREKNRVLNKRLREKNRTPNNTIGRLCAKLRRLEAKKESQKGNLEIDKRESKVVTLWKWVSKFLNIRRN